jgi:dihydropteroate synthase
VTVGCLIVGVLNCTPDSFSDGGRFATVEAAVGAGVAMAEAGADWIDVGGESTRPGAEAVPEEIEIGRVVPVVEGLRRRLPAGVRISVDTYKAGTARVALAAGATVVNDISGGLLEPGILGAAADADATIVLGHLRGTPASMMADIAFTDVLGEVATELRERIDAARAVGCRGIWADPGIGFGKRLEHNLALLRALPALKAELGVPVMVGVSRKAFIGALTGKPAAGRDFGTAAALTAAVLGGADAVRVHDVDAARDVVNVARALARD